MVILYMIFLLPLTLGAYHKAGYGKFCSDTSTRIRNRYDCEVAAAALGLAWGHSWWGPWDFPGCLHTRDPRNKVYFNLSPHASSRPNNPDYAQICTGEDPEKQYGLVVTGGDNPLRIVSSEMISSMGVCVSPDTNIPDLPNAIAGAKSVWLQDIETLMFCGGSKTFVGRQPQFPLGWGATKKCLRLKPGDTAWDDNSLYYMTEERAWFSLNNVNKGAIGAVAAGGSKAGYNQILDSIEHFYRGSWRPLLNHGSSAIKLNHPTYGHCAVHFNIGPNYFLMIIGGSHSGTLFSRATNAVTVINLQTGHNLHISPNGLPPLWAPACVMKGHDIYVSGGGNAGFAYNGVYKGTTAGTFVPIGSLGAERSGHTMGVTSCGTKGQLFVAGGYNPSQSGFPPHHGYIKEIETSVNDGLTWKTWKTTLSQGGEYAAMASVPACTFRCPGP